MKKAKKILMSIIVAVLVAPCMVMLTACGGNAKVDYGTAVDLDVAVARITRTSDIQTVSTEVPDLNVSEFYGVDLWDGIRLKYDLFMDTNYSGLGFEMKVNSDNKIKFAEADKEKFNALINTKMSMKFYMGGLSQTEKANNDMYIDENGHIYVKQDNIKIYYEDADAFGGETITLTETDSNALLDTDTPYALDRFFNTDIEDLKQIYQETAHIKEYSNGNYMVTLHLTEAGAVEQIGSYSDETDLSSVYQMSDVIFSGNSTVSWLFNQEGKLISAKVDGNIKLSEQSVSFEVRIKMEISEYKDDLSITNFDRNGISSYLSGVDWDIFMEQNGENYIDNYGEIDYTKAWNAFKVSQSA